MQQLEDRQREVEKVVSGGVALAKIAQADTSALQLESKYRSVVELARVGFRLLEFFKVCFVLPRSVTTRLCLFFVCPKCNDTG